MKHEEGLDAEVKLKRRLDIDSRTWEGSGYQMPRLLDGGRSIPDVLPV